MKTGGHKVVTEHGSTIYTSTTQQGRSIHAHGGRGRNARNVQIDTLRDGAFIPAQHAPVDPLGPDVLRAIADLIDHESREQES